MRENFVTFNMIDFHRFSSMVITVYIHPYQLADTNRYQLTKNYQVILIDRLISHHRFSSIGQVGTCTLFGVCSITVLQNPIERLVFDWVRLHTLKVEVQLVRSSVPLKSKLPSLISHETCLVSRKTFLVRITEPTSMEYITRKESLWLLCQNQTTFINKFLCNKFVSLLLFRLQCTCTCCTFNFRSSYSYRFSGFVIKVSIVSFSTFAIRIETCRSNWWCWCSISHTNFGLILSLNPKMSPVLRKIQMSCVLCQ